VGTGQHVMEYVGSGVTYNALLEYGGQPNDGNSVIQRFPGRVFYCLTDHNGNQTIGPYFAVEQLTGAVTLATDKFSLAGLEAIGPFRRNGQEAGVQLKEVSNDARLVDSTGVIGSTTVPTQFAVKTYVDGKALPAAGDAGSALVKASSDDYDVSWIPVVLESEKAQPLGVANIDAQGRIVGDGSVIANISANNVSQGTLANARLPGTIGTISTSFVGVGSALSGLNASNITSGSLATYLIGTGSPSGVGTSNIVMSDTPVLYSNVTVRGSTPTIVLRDTDHKSGFVYCDSNVVSIRGGSVDSTTPAQVNGQWPFSVSTSTNDCTAGGNLLAVADVVAYASDERLKSNIRPISETPLADVGRLRGVRFEWREDTSQPMHGTDVGLIAQDVESVLPEAVRPAPFDPTYLTIDFGNKVTALLIEAIKELESRLERLEQGR